MFKIVPRIGTCDAGFSSSKFRSSCLPFVVKQTVCLVLNMRDIGIAFPICPFWGRRGRDQMVVGFRTTVDSRYLEFDGTMEKI
jgi:hypothetical protein